MPREQLLQAILAAAIRAGAEIVTNSEAVLAEPGGKLVTADGTSWQADLVAAADGVRSKVRNSLGLLASRHNHIDGAIRLLVPHVASEYDAVESVRIKEWWRGSRRVLHTPCNRENLLHLPDHASERPGGNCCTRAERCLETELPAS